MSEKNNSNNDTLFLPIVESDMEDFIDVWKRDGLFSWNFQSEKGTDIDVVFISQEMYDKKQGEKNE